MKRALFSVAFAAVAASAWGRQVVLWEDFEKVGCLNRWDEWPTENWEWKYEPLNWYFKFEGEGGGGAKSLKVVAVKKGETYKVELYTRYDSATVYWGNQSKVVPRAGGDWKAAAFAVVMPADGAAHFHLAVPAATRKFDFDDVRVTRCGVAVAPTSLGHIRALFR